MNDPQFNYPNFIDIETLKKPVDISLRVPGSKSITNRALILAALSGDCKVANALRSEDTEVMIDSLQQLGFEVQTDWSADRIAVQRPKNSTSWIPSRKADLFVGNSGTSMRFLTALCALGQGEYRLDGIPRMRERPIQDLLDGLQQLGVDVCSEAGTGCPPVLMRANGLKGGRVRLNAGKSSQFVSALLLALPFANGDSLLELTGDIVSEPYIEMTVQLLKREGIEIESSHHNPKSKRGDSIDLTYASGYDRGVQQLNRYSIPGNQKLTSRSIDVEPDASSASYFFAAAAITGGQATIEGLSVHSLQGDVKFIYALERMGCRVKREDSQLTVIGGKLHGIDIDMNAISDTVMTLAAVACFADGPTIIRNVEHIRHKESDRIEAVATELRKAGIEVISKRDGIEIHPRPIQAAVFETYNDHRMAMSLALLGLVAYGIRINNPGCVAKTYPGFWEDFGRL